MSKYQIEDINICSSSMFHREEWVANVHARENLYDKNVYYSNNKDIF